jgi:hypothetical protein
MKIVFSRSSPCSLQADDIFILLVYVPCPAAMTCIRWQYHVCVEHLDLRRLFSYKKWRIDAKIYKEHEDQEGRGVF